MAHIIFIKTLNQYCLIRDNLHFNLSRSYQITELLETILLQDIRRNIKTFFFSQLKKINNMNDYITYTT